MESNDAELEENELSQDAENAEDELLQDNDSSEMTASENESTWISWFVGLRGNDFFCEVEESFIQDDFNLTGLSNQVPYYDSALEIILDIDIALDAHSEEQHENIESAAEVLYGLIHARYILTNAGMHKMYDKYQNADFGRCPRSFCQGQPVLPAGLSDVTREYAVEVFCPRCQEAYHPRSSKHANLDGAYFGTTFCHLLLLTHPELIVPRTQDGYIPRIFGFRIHESSSYYKLRDRDTQQQKRKQIVKGGKNEGAGAVVAVNGKSS